MSYINRRKNDLHLPKIKRLNYTNRHDQKLLINKLPFDAFDASSSKYIKFFDYPLLDLLVDHSTDPIKNTARQYIDIPIDNSNEGRFKNHEMIIRRNGETTILRPKQDLVLVNGFTPAIRPSSLLPSYQPIMSHTQVASSLSIMNKMSIKKPEQTSIIKTKRNSRYRRNHFKEKFIEKNTVQHSHFPDHFHPDLTQESTFIHLVKQALHEIMEEKASQPAPLMSIVSDFPNQYSSYDNQPCIQRSEEIPFNQYVKQHYNEQQYIPSLLSIPTYLQKEFPSNIVSEPTHPLHSTSLIREHTCFTSSIYDQRNYGHMSGYFF